jgi:uncharacterized membrane-anchored protein
MRLLLRIAFVLSLTVGASRSAVAANEPTPASPAAASASAESAPRKIEIPGVKLIHGPATVKLGSGAEIKVPQDFAFVGPDSLDKFFELTKDIRGGSEVGVLLSPNSWSLYFDYNDIGFVKDDDKKALDATKLYSSLEEGQKASNEDRKSRGWDEMKLQGWVTPPHYDEKTHNLTWSFKLSSSRDNYQKTWLNENIRLLGRGGVMNVTLVTGDPDFSRVETEARAVLADFNYVSGHKYAEFRTGDKVAKYGLAALVVGGAGAIALKTGLLAKLGIVLLKAWKLVAIAVVGLGSFFVRLWKKITGRDTR